jgi:hypothetical protein
MNIFIVPSCIRSLIGALSFEERYEQTLKTFDSIRDQVEDAVIIFTDSSVGGLDQSMKDIIAKKVNYFIDFSTDSVAQDINQKGLKSIGESYLLLNSIHFAKSNIEVNQKGRMFKLGGRCELSDKFTMKDYENSEGKFVFKNRLDSWMDSNIQRTFGSTHILETRLYSWSLDMIDEYLFVLNKNFELLNQGLDTEHAHFLNVPKDKLLEFETLNVGCCVAASNYYIYD